MADLIIRVAGLTMQVADLRSEVPGLKSEVPDLRPGKSRLNLTTAERRSRFSVTPLRPLRSSDRLDLFVPRVKTTI